MFTDLDAVVERYEDLSRQLIDPGILADQGRYRELAKERSRLEEVVTCYRSFRRVEAEEDDARDLLASPDEDLVFLAKEELESLQEKKATLSAQLRRLLLPRDPRDEKNVIVEIRAGTGGEEAALFAADLCRAYSRYAERHNWRVEVLDANPTDIGGFKEVILGIAGQGAFSRLKFESGVHRVQRIPDTEASGRIHTSAATVAVLPEAEEVDVAINPDDLRIDTLRSGGAGGQHVNKTESAVRITHLPTGIVVMSQDERSQHKNKDKGMRVLRARLLDLREREAAQSIGTLRRSQVGSGDRSERIRTYNFPQGRVTDHRIGLTLYRLPAALDGDLDELIDALITRDESEKLKADEGLGA